MMVGEGEKPSGGPTPHIPVMLAEVLEALSPQDNDIIIDGTFGAGGYTRVILDAANCRVIAFDRDETAISAGQALVDAYKGRLTLIHDRFSGFADHLDRLGIEAVDGLVLDIGVSSMQRSGNRAPSPVPLCASGRKSPLPPRWSWRILCNPCLVAARKTRCTPPRAHFRR